MTPEFLLVSAAACAAVAAVAVRDHRRQRKARRQLLDGVASELDEPQISFARDGFPRLDGRYGGAPVRIELVCDSMVVRRLPQLWMSVTLVSAVPVDGAVGVLTRHAGNEFYAVTPDFPDALEIPSGFPKECIVRGQSSASVSTLSRVARSMGEFLLDPRTKEVVVTRNGVRVISQAAEGARGAHLLLRQAVFDTVRITPDMLRQSLQLLIKLRDAAAASTPAQAA